MARESVELQEAVEDAAVGTETALAASRWWRRLPSWPITVWQVGLVVAIAMYVAYFAGLSLDIHHGLGTSSYDSGLYDQGIWLMSRFDAPFVTLMGRNLMGDHTSFILVSLVPFYWLWPAAGTMFFAQALVIGLGAVPVFLYARRRLESEAMALVLAGAYLLHPAVGWTNLENFHPDAFLGLLVGGAIWAALERHWKTYAVFVVLSLLVKEDVSLVIVPLGIWVGLRRDRRIGLITVIGSVSFMLVAMLVVMRSLTGVAARNAWRIPFGGVGGFIKTTFRRPGDVIEHVRSDGRPWYVWQMLTPFAYVFTRRPSVALIGFVALGANVISTFWYQYHVQYHYSLVIVPALALGTAYAVVAFGRVVRTYAVGAVALFAISAAYLWGPLPFSRNEIAYWAPDHPVAEQMREIIDDIPADAVVAAYHRVTPHLAHREKIYQFPNPFRVVLYGPETSLEGTRLDELADEVEYVVLPVAKEPDNEADWDAIRPAFDLVESNASWELWRRTGRPLPPPPGEPQS